MADDVQPKQLYELGPIGKECRWPVGEHRDLIGGFLFCARPVALAEVYCEHHTRLAYPPAKVRGHG